MGKVVLKQEFKTVQVGEKKETIKLLVNNKYNDFNPNLLGLGDISRPSDQVDAIAAMFDLSGFTNFCRQVDPHLAVPEYLNQLLDWLFNQIKIHFVSESYDEVRLILSSDSYKFTTNCIFTRHPTLFVSGAPQWHVRIFL